MAAGEQDKGNSLAQLYHPHGVSVDHLGNIYVADCHNHRIICWCSGSKENVSHSQFNFINYSFVMK